MSTLSWLFRQSQAVLGRRFSLAHADDEADEQEVCRRAEAALQQNKPADALYALNSLLLAQGPLDKPRSSRVRLLRGIAGCMLGRPAAARRELGAIPKTQASVDELLAAAQACILCADHAGALQLLDALATHTLAEGTTGRLALCRAALHVHAGRLRQALEALPAPAQCTTADASFCLSLRADLQKKLNNHCH